MSYETTWRNLKCLLLSERTSLNNNILYASNYMTFGKGKTIDTVVGKGYGGGRNE